MLPIPKNVTLLFYVRMFVLKWILKLPSRRHRLLLHVLFLFADRLNIEARNKKYKKKINYYSAAAGRQKLLFLSQKVCALISALKYAICYFVQKKTPFGIETVCSKKQKEQVCSASWVNERVEMLRAGQD